MKHLGDVERQKLEIEHFLEQFGFSKEKSAHYYYRFYRYAPFGGRNMLLKEAAYAHGYNKLKEIGQTQEMYYGRIGFSEIEQGFSVRNYPDILDPDIVFPSIQSIVSDTLL